MIKPIYFPYTYVPQWVAETLAACFKQFTVYQPSGRELPSEMQSWVQENVMDVRVPVQTEDAALEKMAKEFRAFAGLHDDSKNLKTAVYRGRQGAIPCFSESAASRIVSNVKKHSGSAPAETDSNSLFSAQVFLDFAQEFDRQNAELDRGLGANEQHLDDLFKELSGSIDNDLPATPLSADIRVEDSGEYMALDRLKAWLRLFMMEPADSGLLVTSSPSVFDHLIENLTAAQKVVQSLKLPVTVVEDGAAISWRDSFLRQMKQLFEKGGGTGENNFGDLPLPLDHRSNIRLTLYRVSGQSPADMFGRIFEDQITDTLKSNRSAEISNTLIGLIDRRSSDTKNTKH